MPRYARELSSKQTYHVMLRGNNREKVFIDDEDKQRMVDTLREKKEQEEFTCLYAVRRTVAAISSIFYKRS